MTIRKATTFGAALALAGLSVAVAQAQNARAGDWPQWRGPDRTGLSRETGLLKQWPAGGPRLVWKVNGRGLGYGSLSTAGGRIYGLGNQGANEAAWALDARTGQQVWATPIGAAVRVDRGDGPRSTPTVDGNRVYVLGVSGDLACLDAASGRAVWTKSLVRDFGGNVPHWGYSESPLIDGDKVIVTPGGRTTMVALNKSTGQPVWTSQIPQADVHYASAIVADVNGVRQYIQFLRGGVVGVSAQDGRPLWRYTNPANGTANCSTPIYKDGHVFAASAYGTGGGLAKLSGGPGGMSAQEVYFTKAMQNHHGGMVVVGDYLYGFDNANLTCLNFKTGQVMWTDRSVGKGSLTYADGHLYCRGEARGGVALVEANPERYVEKGRFTQPDLSGANTWAYPVVAGGRLYLRDQDTLLCYDVSTAQ